MDQLECSATIVDVGNNESGEDTVILEQTVFYPQGGGQPYDTGTIQTPDQSFIFNVAKVRFVDGVVHHIGKVEKGKPSIGLEVECTVNSERRKVNTRLHSAGHLIDMVLKKLSVDWRPGKGYHFPEGPYVEYSGSLDGYDTEKLMRDIEQECAYLVAKNIPTKVTFDSSEHESGKPARTVYYGDFGIPCGGTHVSNLSQIGKVVVRKIKKVKDSIRVSYDIE